MRQAWAALLGVVAGLLLGGAALAQSSWVRELEAASTRYHENLAQLDRIRDGLEAAVRVDSHPDNWIALARVCFIWGDVRAATREEKLRAYDRGRQAGLRATEIVPRAAAAHFWYALNTARWGQTNGILRSLTLLPAVRRALATTLELDPRFTAAHVVAGYVDYEVPALFGGDLARAEERFRTALRQDPHFSAARVGLARVLIKRGETAEARRELRGVLDDPAPTNRADWVTKDTRDARELLASLGS